MNKDKYIILRDRELMLTPDIWNAEVQTSPKLTKIYGRYLKYTWIIFNKGRAESTYLKKDWQAMAKYVALKMVKEKKYFKDIENQVARRRKKIKKFIKEIKRINLSKLTFNQLYKLAFNLKQVWTGFELANVSAWYLGGDYYLDLLEEKFRINRDELSVLTSPKEKTEVTKFEITYLNILSALKKKKISIESAAEILADGYGWLPYNYDGPIYWDKKYFIKKLREEKMPLLKIKNRLEKIKKNDLYKKNQRTKIIKNYSLASSDLKLINIARTFSVWIDERKKYDYRLNYFYGLILLEIGRRYGLDYKHLKFLFIDELTLLLKNRDFAKNLAEKRIKNRFIVKYTSGKRQIMTAKETRAFLIDLKLQLNTLEIKGQIACHGNKKIYRGIVKVLGSGKEAGKVKQGDFLITAMTTPDYVQAMKKAIGFITDEGGVTSHAAIIAREMNKPCIIGTKIATKILHDGDYVEVDASKGTVKILKKA